MSDLGIQVIKPYFNVRVLIICAWSIMLLSLISEVYFYDAIKDFITSPFQRSGSVMMLLGVLVEFDILRQIDSTKANIKIMNGLSMEDRVRYHDHLDDILDESSKQIDTGSKANIFGFVTIGLGILIFAYGDLFLP